MDNDFNSHRINMLDILAFAAHPDDVELACSGTLAKQISFGQKVGIIDLTQGELGTRGNAPLRLKEAAKSAEVLGLTLRENLGLADGFFEENQETLLKIVEKIRLYKPKLVLCNAPEDRHPDHGRASKLVARACFLAGLSKIETSQAAYRPLQVLHYIQDRPLNPSLVVDISSFFDLKMKAIQAFSSQFYTAESGEPITPIAREDFLPFIEARAREHGRLIGTTFGEGFIQSTPVKVSQLLDIL